jgi:menaquinone-dependent protoporphyrinogen IX oxidase
VNAVQILSPEELNPTTCGDLRLVDSETGAMQEVTFGKFRLNAYQHAVQNFVQRLREFCATRGINFFSVSSATPLEQLLLKQLRTAEVWG